MTDCSQARVRFYLYAGLSPLLTRLLSLRLYKRLFQLVCQVDSYRLDIVPLLPFKQRHSSFVLGCGGRSGDNAHVFGWVVVSAAIFLTALSALAP